MKLGVGAEVYNVDQGKISARGHSLAPEELGEGVRERVKDLVSDRPGREKIQELLERVNLTGFAASEVARVLAEDELYDEWRVGEAFAEAYLSDNHHCLFPWRSRWDQRNPRASPAGAELVGFHSVGVESRFAFGEVKTSTKGPRPSVMHGEAGLPAQVTDIRDDPDISGWLVRHLTLRAQGQPWMDAWKASFRAFLSNPRDFVVFGVLVRDLDPSPNDLADCARKAAHGCHPDTQIHLRGLYVPAGFLKSFLPPAGGATT